MAQDGLAVLAQDDFSAGSFQGVARHLIPRNGVYEVKNGLLDDNGSIYKRGGSQYLSTADLNTSGSLPLFAFDGYLSAGRRTVFADASGYGVLDDTDGPISLGGVAPTGPRKGVVIGGVLVVDGKLYAGSRKTANYSTGTISTTNGSKVITGAGTTWNTLVDAGMLLQIGTERFYVIASVDSTTQITLTEAYEGSTAAGKAYTLYPLATLPAAQQSDVYAVAGDRLLVFSGRTITFSNGRSPGDAGTPPAGQLRWQTFTATDRWEIPDGVQLLGAATLHDNVLVFTTGGVYALTNLAYDLTDAAGNLQQSLQRINPDLILWGNAGIASWGNALVVPATDGVWLLDGQNEPQKVSNSIPGRYVGYVQAAHRPGGAVVVRSHYCVPVVSAANGAIDFLVCRLDRPVRTSIGIVFPWSWMSGAAAAVGALAVRQVQASSPKLLGAGIGPSNTLVAANLTAFRLNTGGSILSSQDRYYVVTAIVGGVEQSRTAELLSPKRTVGFSSSTQVVNLTWDAVPGATSYRVYRGTTPGGENAFFTVTGGITNFTDTGAAGTAGTPPSSGTGGARILDLSGLFQPSAAVKNDHDGTSFWLDITTRDFTPDRLNIEALVKQLRVRYELLDAATDGPTISAWYSLGRAVSGQALWGHAVWGTDTWGASETSEEVQLSGQAPASDGRAPYVWSVGQRTRFIRFRLRNTQPVARLALRTLELKTRPSGRQ